MVLPSLGKGRWIHSYQSYKKSSHNMGRFDQLMLHPRSNEKLDIGTKKEAELSTEEAFQDATVRQNLEVMLVRKQHKQLAHRHPHLMIVQ